MRNTLYIIGNGFDLKHGMATRYSDFKQWLIQHNHEDVIQELQHVFPIRDTNGFLLWSDFENALGQYDISRIMEWSWEDLNITENSFGGLKFGEPFSSLLDTEIIEILENNFRKWGDSITPAKPPQIVNLDTDALYVTFNYTDTLETLYCIPEKQILHIHGRASKQEKLIVGHNREVDPSDYWDDNLDMRENNERMQHINDMNELRKPYWDIIDRNESFFNKMKNIQDVYIYGHSCATVDYPYFQKIKDSIRNDALWHFFPYNENDKQRILQLISKIGIPNYDYQQYDARFA